MLDCTHITTSSPAVPPLLWAQMLDCTHIATSSPAVPPLLWVQMLDCTHITTSSPAVPPLLWAQMLEARDLSFFPILKTSSIIFEDVSNEVLLERVEKLSQQLSENTQRIEAIAQS